LELINVASIPQPQTAYKVEYMGGGVFVGGPNGRLWVDGQAVISNNSVQNDMPSGPSDNDALGGGVAGSGDARIIIITGGKIDLRQRFHHQCKLSLPKEKKRALLGKATSHSKTGKYTASARKAYASSIAESRP
jgi:hypothetical protein